MGDRIERPERLHVMLSGEERKMLRELAQRKGVTPSTEIRLLLRDAFARTASPTEAAAR